MPFIGTSSPVRHNCVVVTDSYNSDSPFALVAAGFEAIPVLTGTQETGFAFTLYTGDLVSHDAENQLSR